MSEKDRAPELSKVEQAAVLLMSLGEKEAANVLRHLGPKEVQKVGAAMATVHDVTKDQMESVVTNFVEMVGEETGLGVGADSYIRNMLNEALGEEKAGGMIDRILIGGNTQGLDTLKWMDAKAVADVVRYEHPQIQAIVLSYLDADQSGEVLSVLPENTRMDLIQRIARLESVQPEALAELNKVLEKQFSGKGGTKSAAIGGVKVAADIMNFIDTSVEAQLMEQLKEVDEELGNQIEDLMFVFDNLIDVDDRGIQALMREISSETLVLALKGADEPVREKIFGNMSKRAAELLRDDLEAKGPVKVSEVEGAQKEILAIARRMADAGEITLGGKGGEEML